MNLALGPNRWPFTLEKWYIDTLMSDGSILLVYLGRIRTIGLSMARVTAELFRPDQDVIRGDAKAKKTRGEEEKLTFGPAGIDGDMLTFETPGLSGELRFAPRYPPITLRAPFLEEGHRRLNWTVEIPDADVEGSLRWPAGELKISGRGYRDRVWFDLLPWRFPISTLVWGRGTAGQHSANWVKAETPAGEIDVRWLDGKVVTEESWPVELGESRRLIETAVVDLEGLRLGPLRPLLRRLTKNPIEVKWAAPICIAGESGVAIHEIVRWQ